MMTALETILAGQNREGTGWPTIVVKLDGRGYYDILGNPAKQTPEGLLFREIKTFIDVDDIEALKAIFNVVIIDEEVE